MRGDGVDWNTLYNEFLTGEGPEYSGFGQNHPMTLDLMNSWIVNLAQVKFDFSNTANRKAGLPLSPLIYYDVPFGLVGAAASGTTMTEQFVGGARISIIPGDGYTTYIVNNTTDRYSYLLHLGESRPRQEGVIVPMGTIYQRFTWVVPND